MAPTGCQWRAIPKDFPPYSTVQGYFYAWSHKGLLAHINHMLVTRIPNAAAASYRLQKITGAALTKRAFSPDKPRTYGNVKRFCGWPHSGSGWQRTRRIWKRENPADSGPSVAALFSFHQRGCAKLHSASKFQRL
jgi:hypothetical protein